MTPLNTIIEEEKKKFDENFKRRIQLKNNPDGVTVSRFKHFLTTAMQRAYEAGEKKGREEEKKRIGELLERGGFRVKTLLR